MDSLHKKLKEYQALPLGYYHLCTDGWSEGCLCHTDSHRRRVMSWIALSSIRLPIRFYGYELMANHMHFALSGKGDACVRLFQYLVRKINAMLKSEGYPTLPEDYGFKLIPIDNKGSMQSLLLYLARNAYERGLCTPCGHKWGTGYLLYNELADLIRGVPVKDLSKRSIYQQLGIKDDLPPYWEIHPELGILPRCVVDMNKTRELFPTVKDYMVRLVKDYESYARIAQSVGETLEWSRLEVRDIIRQFLLREYPGRNPNDLDNDTRCRMAVALNAQYHIPPSLLSAGLGVSERIILQSLHSKDYGFRRR